MRQASKSPNPITHLSPEENIAKYFRVLVGYTGEQTWTEKEEAQVRRKIDWRLMPILCITYGLQYYDKAMLSQAVGLSRTLMIRC